ncbi:hypothetical protein ACOME3_008988 [Neoechinorhynchus agilis]
MSSLGAKSTVFKYFSDVHGSPAFDAELADVVSRQNTKAALDVNDAMVEFSKLQESFDSRCLQVYRVSENGRLISQPSANGTVGAGVQIDVGHTAQTTPDDLSGYYGMGEIIPPEYYQHDMAYDGGAAAAAAAVNELQTTQSVVYPATAAAAAADYYGSQEWTFTQSYGTGGTVPMPSVPNPTDPDMYPPGFYDNRYVSTDVTIEGQQGQDFFIDGMQQVRRRPEMSI